MTRWPLVLAFALTMQGTTVFDMPLDVPPALREEPLEWSVLCQSETDAASIRLVWRALDRAAPVARGPARRHCRVLVRVTGTTRYLASSSTTWAARSVPLRLQTEWMRTVTAPAPVSSLAWVSGAGASAHDCRGGEKAACAFVPADDAGVLVTEDANGLRFALVGRGENGGAWQPAKWGRLVRVRTPRGAPVTLAVHALTAAFRSSRAKLQDVRVSNDAHVHAVAGYLFWIEGRALSARLDVSAPGAATVRLPLRSLAGGPTVPYDLVLSPEETIEGEVFSRGTRLPGALIFLTRALRDGDTATAAQRTGATKDDDERPAEFVGETTTDADGGFRFGGLAREEYELLVVHPSRGRARVTLTASARPRVRVTPRAIVRGRVMASGVPVDRAVVSVLPAFESVAASRQPMELFAESVRTSLDGRFEAVLPDQGLITLTVVKDDAATRVALGDAASLSGEVDVGDIVLESPIEVEVRVRLEPGCVLQAAGPLGQPGMTVVRALPVAPGRWALRARLAGRWLIEASCGGEPVHLSPAMVTIERGMQAVTLEVGRGGG